jgi:hypothetical protein
MKKRVLYAVTCCLLILAAKVGSAQMPDDGWTMRKGELCLVVDYMHGSFTEYWEGKRLRENLNLGEFTSKMVMPMVGYGITDRLTAFAGVPYIENSSDAGTMTGKKGWQDLALELKYLFFNKANGKWNNKIFGTAGFSFPVTNYPPDFLPYSIGLGSTNLETRVIGHFVYTDKWFSTIQTGYIFRSNITVDRQTYYTDVQHNSDEMTIPNVWDGSIRLGYNVPRFRADIHYNWFDCTSGTDIRRNDMPYPGNEMDMGAIGIMGLLWIPKIDGLAIHASADQVVAGRNVGKSFTWMAGLQYVFTPFNKKTNAK